ncbi:EAL domain-containing protein [Thiomicrospira aerophila]|uniref:EAL domain-containing protein n=1 Tax=Thiomicrospira aerophila TaxID=92245 RepID=UPI00022C500F|nr:EAL domain-containing protein [Thiomicrospira aerophila]
MIKCLKKHTALATCLLLSLVISTQTQGANNQATPQLVLGVQTFQDKSKTLNEWTPIVAHLNQQLHSVQLDLQVYFLDELNTAVRDKKVDLIFSNPQAYINLAVTQGLSSPLASLMTLVDHQPIRVFGGVIATRSDYDHINDYKDIRRRIIAAPSIDGFGGYLMQKRELQNHGIQIYPFQVLTTGSQDLAISALLDGQAEIAFVRTGVLESLTKDGRIQKGQIKVLGQKDAPNFPLALSTQLYPEWPLSALDHVDMFHASEITGAFLGIPYGHPVLEAANLYGFSIPTDYEQIRQLMMELNVPPYEKTNTILLNSFINQHRMAVHVGLVAMVLFIIMLGVILFFNYRLKRSNEQLIERDEDLRIAAVAFETQKAVVITDKFEQIIRVNYAFSEITGFSNDEVMGQTPGILRSRKHNQNFYAKIWPKILADGSWQGEICNRRKNGELYPTFQVINAIKNDQNEITHFLFAFNDISEQKRNERNIYEMAFYDPLTGLANRRLLENHITKALAAAERHHHYCALMFIDLDHFKNLNDSLGHNFGDELLKRVAARLERCVRKEDIVARPGGDEFIILMENLSTDESEAANQALAIANKIIEQCNRAYTLSGNRYTITASLGIHLFSSGDHTSIELMKRSDLAMYQAKEQGRNSVRFFDPDMEKKVENRSQLEHDLRQAIDNREFLLFYQKKVNAQEELQGYEALIRWPHPEKNMISPADFIPVAEETGLIIPIGDWVLEQACQTLQQFQQNKDTQHLNLSVNVSVKQFRQADFVPKIIAKINHYNIDSSKLELEITESMLMDNLEDTVTKMKELKTIGLAFSLDDFGTGYSSLSYLKNLPLSTLKVDKSFVRDMLIDKEDAAIVETIIALAKTLKLQVIAEGVEQIEQVDTLKKLGCDLFQGFLYSKPQPLE